MELVESAIERGPAVIIISVDAYNKLKKPKQSLMDFFSSAPRVDLDISRSDDYGRDAEL